MAKRLNNRRLGLEVELDEERAQKRRRLQDCLQRGEEAAPDVAAASQVLERVASRICIPGLGVEVLRQLREQLMGFLQRVGEPRGMVARPEHMWEGLIRADRPTGNSIMGAVLREQHAQPPAKSDKQNVWVFKLGFRSQSAAVPRHWAVFPEDVGASSGPERILAMPEETPAYRRSKARSLAGQNRELLNRARVIGGSEGPV